MKKQRIKAFTLVELIIVITILAILATIGFMSFQSYTGDARDVNRTTSLKTISNGLQIYEAKNSVLPIPDEQTVNIMSGTSLVSIQGYAGISVLQKLKASDIKDPSDNSYYTYIVNSDKTKYQLLSMLEKDSSLAMNNNLLNEAYARTDYTSRYAYTIGNKVGVFFSGTTNNTPIQETMSGNLDLTSGANATKIFKVMFSNQTTNSGTLSITGANLPAIIQTETNSTTTTITATNPGIKTNGFSTSLYTGNGSTQSITTGIDMSTQWGTDPSQTFGGLTLIKQRTGTQYCHAFDTIRGAGNVIYTSLTNIEAYAPTKQSAFLNNGYLLGSEANVNQSTLTYTSWNFQTTHRVTGTTNHSKTYTCQYNPYTGFTMIKYQGSGTAGHIIPNCLGRKLDFVTIKSLSGAVNWISSTSSFTKDEFLSLNLSNAKGTSAYQYVELTNTSVIVPSSTASAGGNSNVNASGDGYIIYGWANSYYDASNNLVGNYEIGTYNGTGLAGNKITTKAKPAWIMVKSINSIDNWYVFDNKRLNDGYVISPNLSNAEDTSYDYMNFNSDGFTFNASYMNQTSSQYLYVVVYDNDNGSGKSTYMLK